MPMQKLLFTAASRLKCEHEHSTHLDAGVALAAFEGHRRERLDAQAADGAQPCAVTDGAVDNNALGAGGRGLKIGTGPASLRIRQMVNSY